MKVPSLRKLISHNNSPLEELHYGTAFRHAAATPLSTLLINLEMIEQHRALRESSYLQQAVSSAQRLKKLFQLEASNTQETKEAAFLVKPALESAVKLVSPLRAKTLIRTHLVFPDELELKGNEFYFQEAVICTLKNAIEAYDATGADQNRVVLLTGRREKITSDQPGLKLSFIDGGSGLGWLERSLVFAEGYTNKKSGSGLGLVWVKRVVEEHLEGEIELQSRKQQGTTMTWHLPL